MKLNKKLIAKTMALILSLGTLGCFSYACASKENSVLIYTSAEDYRCDYMRKRLKEEFPDYNITVEYMTTGNHAAKLLAEGTKTECDITYDMDYGYMTQLENAGILADLSSYDFSIYEEDTVPSSKKYIIENRNGGSVILNPDVLKKHNLPEPTSYQDLLDAKYKNLISMPSPKSSGTGYMFLKNLVNAWGETEAFSYFDGLTKNILQYTSSGSGPVNALVQGEVAIGLGMTSQAVTQINEGSPLKIVFFEEGSPFSLYGQAMIKGKENRTAVKEVFDFLIETYNYENNEKFYPEKIFKDKIYAVQNYPQNIVYGNMSNNTTEERERLLNKWKY